MGEMNISARKNYENPVPALERHRRKKGLGVGFCQCIFFYFSYFSKCLFRERGGLVTAIIIADINPY